MSLFSGTQKKKVPTAVKTPMAAAKQVAKVSPKVPQGPAGGPLKHPSPVQAKPTTPVLPPHRISPDAKPGFGTLAPSAGVAPTKTGGPRNRAIAATRKPQVTAKPKAADPTAKSYTDDIYAKYEGQQAKAAATKTPKKASKASYR